MVKWLAIAAVLTGGAARAETPTAVDVGLLVASELAIAADLSQSLDIKNHNGAKWETNPFLGQHPSDKRVLLTGGATMLVVGATWAVLPKDYRSIFAALVLGVEIAAISNNIGVGLSFRLP
jgi:hypothetical protein